MHVEPRSGMAVVVAVAAAVLALAGLAQGDAGHFFAETPKHLPRIGRRGDLPPLATLMIEEDTRGGVGRGPAGTVAEALARVDGDGDGCITVTELLRVPVVRVAVLLQNPELLTPADSLAQPQPQPLRATEKEGDAYTAERRPEPHLLHHYLQK